MAIDLSCPNCGFEQKGGDECLSCGVIFAKFSRRLPGPPMRPPKDDPPRAFWSKFSGLRTFYRIFRWVALVATLMAFYLMLQPAPTPYVKFDKEATRRAEFKVKRFRNAVRRGRNQDLQLTEPELNAWLDSNLVLVDSEPISDAPPQKEVGVPELPTRPKTAQTLGVFNSLNDLTYEDVQSSVKNVRIQLIEDLVRTYVRFELYGKELSFQLKGRLSVADGYLHLDPISGKLGSLPLPGPSLRAAVRRLFQSPENRDKFRVPDYIQAIRVHGGELQVVARSR